MGAFPIGRNPIGTNPNGITHQIIEPREAGLLLPRSFLADTATQTAAAPCPPADARLTLMFFTAPLQVAQPPRFRRESPEPCLVSRDVGGGNGAALRHSGARQQPETTACFGVEMCGSRTARFWGACFSLLIHGVPFIEPPPFRRVFKKGRLSRLERCSKTRPSGLKPHEKGGSNHRASPNIPLTANS